ncbi:MAG: hypothetical protein ABIG71_01065 [Candidatus Uhrbacteria bacterium]
MGTILKLIISLTTFPFRHPVKLVVLKVNAWLFRRRAWKLFQSVLDGLEQVGLPHETRLQFEERAKPIMRLLSPKFYAERFTIVQSVFETVGKDRRLLSASDPNDTHPELDELELEGALRGAVAAEQRRLAGRQGARLAAAGKRLLQG